VIVIGVAVDVRQVEEDVDLGRRDAEGADRRADLPMVDGRAVGRDAAVPQRFALPAGIAGR
jgi:hypothetical protein